MATEKTYNGEGPSDGNRTTFDITFPYLTHADIAVSVGGVTKTVDSDYSITGNTVTFGTAPATGTDNVKLFRNTNIDTPEHSYSAGSSITAANLNENQKQALYAIEEAKLVTTTSGGITTGNKNDITVNSDTDWVIRTNAVEKSMMADNSVGTDEIETNAVTAAELADNAVDTNAIVNLNVTTGKIANDAINGTKIADDSIDSEHIVADSIDTEHYAPGSVDATALASNVVTNVKVADDAIGIAELSATGTASTSTYLRGDNSWVNPTDDWPAGSILETVTYVCDGVSFTQRGVTYNSTAVTAAQTLTTTYVDLTGSTITYTPPSAAKTVIYEFYATDAALSGVQSLWHTKLFLGGVEVTKAKRTKFSNGGSTNIIKWAFPIGGTADAATGRVNTWTGAKTIKLSIRAYDGSHGGKFHETFHWDGGYTNNLVLPQVTITAIS